MNLVLVYSFAIGFLVPVFVCSRHLSALLVLIFCGLNVFCNGYFMELANVNDMSLESVYGLVALSFALLCLMVDWSMVAVHHATLFALALFANILLMIDVHNLAGRGVTLIYPAWEYVIALITVSHIGVGLNGIRTPSRSCVGFVKLNLYNLLTAKKTQG